MSAEAIVGIVAIVAAVIVPIATGLIVWMTRVHWMLAQIKQQLEQLTQDRATHQSEVAELWATLSKLKDRMARVEEKLKLHAGGSWLLRDLDKGLDALEEKEGSSDDHPAA